MKQIRNAQEIKYKLMNKILKNAVFILIMANCLVFSCPGLSSAETTRIPNPLASIDFDARDENGELSVVLEIFLLLTVLSLAPAILIMVTSFTRIVIVLSILRQAIGTHQTPPNQVIVGLALFLTLFIMMPVWHKIHQEAVKPYLDKAITQKQAFSLAAEPLKKFMVKQTREKDIAMLIGISDAKRPNNIEDVSITVLIPAFIISELKTAFQMGFLLYVPFLVLDIVISSILLSMGMMMLPPVMISLPFKLMLFVLADGWHLIIGSIVKSFA
jgi:flagellar biosynthesis protein FliP